MCLITFAWQSHPRFPLIVVANRDEYYQRPAAEARFWEEAPEVLAGRDLQAGGTWLGVTRNGRWTAVTNYREGQQQPAPRSRGELTRQFLLGEQSPPSYAGEAVHRGSHYGGFSLLLGDDNQLLYCSNRQPHPQTLAAGIYSLSNHLLDTPWPKAVHARQELKALIDRATPDPEALLAVLQRDEPYADELLPDTGVGIELERLLSPPFIRSADYGTRCTTVLMKDILGEITLLEQNYWANGEPGALHRYRIQHDVQ